MQNRWYLLASFAFCFCIAGCSERQSAELRVPVSGVVLVDGRPLDRGTIRFVPTSGRPVSSSIQKDGSFQLREHSVSYSERGLDVIPGHYRVAVSAAEVINAELEQVRWLAPSRYADFRSSGIEMEVEAAESELLIELTWKDSESAADNSDSKVSDAREPDSTDGSSAEIEQKELLEK